MAWEIYIWNLNPIEKKNWSGPWPRSRNFFGPCPGPGPAISLVQALVPVLSFLWSRPWSQSRHFFGPGLGSGPVIFLVPALVPVPVHIGNGAAKSYCKKLVLPYKAKAILPTDWVMLALIVQSDVSIQFHIGQSGGCIRGRIVQSGRNIRVTSETYGTICPGWIKCI